MQGKTFGFQIRAQSVSNTQPSGSVVTHRFIQPDIMHNIQYNNVHLRPIYIRTEVVKGLKSKLVSILWISVTMHCGRSI